MSPQPARIFVFFALFLAWLLTARAALADEPSVAEASLDELPGSASSESFGPPLEPDDVRVWTSPAAASLGGSRASAYVALRAFTERRSDGFRETAGFLMVGLPFDRLLAPKQDVQLVSLRSPADVATDEGDEPEEGSFESEAMPRQPAARNDRISGAPDPDAGERAGGRLARACVLAALRAHGVGDDDRLDSLAARARASALLPELRLGASRATDASLRLSPTQYDPYRYTEGEAAGYRLDARVSFRLDRLLFADQEVALERIRFQRLEARSKLSVRVLRAVFDWQRARALERDALLSQEERAAAAIRVLEAEMTLDVLTGGWFSEMGPR